MKYELKQLRQIFQSPFDAKSWPTFLANMFGATQLRQEPQVLPTADTERGYYLGSLDVNNYHIGFFHFELLEGSVVHRRIGLRKFVKTYIGTSTGEYDAALVVFSDKDHWRFSFITDIADIKTSPKRFTFVFGDSAGLYNTAVHRFDDLQQKGITFDRIREAFSVESLSIEFFNEYREHYADFVQYITGKRYVQVKANKWEEKKMHDPNEKLYNEFGRKDRDIRDYVKKMMGRLVFLCFIQRKGWLGGDQNYLQDLFKNSPKQNDFLDSVLEPLFFGLLNTRPAERASLFNREGWNLSLIKDAETIPYLNGGLFEQDENDKHSCCFPRELFSNPSDLFGDGEPKNYSRSKDFDYMKFRGLFDFFAAYNFTVDENDPNDAEIGVDPEMLGKIFENLLEDNKDKGAFYTPKEIVQYMCRESLIAYLKEAAIKNGKEADEDKIRALIDDPTEAVSTMSQEQIAELYFALKDIKICDPAIGSGAFPMGLLNELVGIRLALATASGHLAYTAELKKEIICNNIYGVDIEKGAIDIARLRFWLSIVVDLDKPEPLPNFDYKFMQGNSLITTFDGEYVELGKLKEKKDKTKGNTQSKTNLQVETLKKELAELQRTYFTLSGEEKYKREIDIKLKTLDIIEAQLRYEQASAEENNIQQSSLDF